jgi:glycerol kinase
MVFDAAGSEIARRQIEHQQILPAPGWVEHDPIEIAARVNEVIAGALRTAGLTGRDLAAVGLGAAYAAGLAVGFWKTLDELRSNWKADRQWEPAWSADQRETAYAGWKKAVEKSFT